MPTLPWKPAVRLRRRSHLPTPPSPGARVAPLAALALIAALGGCSQASSATGSSTSTAASSADKAVKFAQCMRTNGVANFPDPGPSGQFTIDEIANGSGVNTTSSAFVQAMNACRSLEPAGFAGSARSTQQQSAALQFARCVRADGVPDFPDPTPNGPLIDTTRIPSAATASGMSALHAAMQHCSSYAAAAGVSRSK